MSDQPETIPTIAPEPVNLDYLSDRARAYVVGLEARLKSLRLENDELRAKLADPSQRDEKAVRDAYKKGWSACASKLADQTKAAIDAINLIHPIRTAVMREYLSPRGIEETPA